MSDIILRHFLLQNKNDLSCYSKYMYWYLKKYTGHSMSSQPPDGQHVTDFAEILHTIWDMKKNPGTEDEHSETSEARDMALESFWYFEISRTASIIENSNFFVLDKYFMIVVRCVSIAWKDSTAHLLQRMKWIWALDLILHHQESLPDSKHLANGRHYWIHNCSLWQ